VLKRVWDRYDYPDYTLGIVYTEKGKAIKSFTIQDPVIRARAKRAKR